ncbi:16S rRNA processing protein RimM [Hymenobacter busanensis]|uniref:Ribosome maturation factor RimM n=1 Tax=Hymenobacter busanensis TaxID=2607656 RepID=A0A7L5A4Q8_9BACT|nr:ribosome maturation factor RimM [Hymenobacter busanensis]KAA9338364.1 16S rRNA processing protein RimM [Hymenobacter busanensis]QHJ09210.1 16S rRNA processing protein RimM [Hymenobacter busanensis]
MTLDESYELGYVVKTHGLKGQVVAEFDVDDVEEYLDVEEVFVERPVGSGKLYRFAVERLSQQAGTRVLLKLKGVDRIEDAELLRGLKLFRPLDELPELEDDQFYFHDVVGFTVVDANLGKLGTVEAFYELPEQDLLAMRYQGQEVLIPVVDELVQHADEDSKELYVTLPEGLLEVYLSPPSRERDEPDEFDEA